MLNNKLKFGVCAAVADLSAVHCSLNIHLRKTPAVDTERLGF